MKFLKWLAVSVGALVLLIVIVGLLSPRQIRIQRSLTISAPPESLFAQVNEPKKWENWSKWYRDEPTMNLTYFGGQSGAGAGYEWHGKKQGNGRLVITKSEPAQRVDYDVDFMENGSGKGFATFEPKGTETLVTLGMDTDMGANPFMRVMGLFMDALVGPDFEAGLNNMKASIGSEAGASLNPTLAPYLGRVNKGGC